VRLLLSLPLYHLRPQPPKCSLQDPLILAQLQIIKVPLTVLLSLQLLALAQTLLPSPIPPNDHLTSESPRQTSYLATEHP
jgi:hypothetical protein